MRRFEQTDSGSPAGGLLNPVGLDDHRLRDSLPIDCAAEVLGAECSSRTLLRCRVEGSVRSSFISGMALHLAFSG